MTAEQEEAALRADPVQREATGRRVEQKLFEKRQVKPTFSTKQQIERFERDELNRFAASVPGGNLIFGGFPNFWIEIKRDEEQVNDKVRGDFAPIYQVTYEITLKSADDGSVVSRGRFSDVCIESEALLTYPTRCRILRPYALRQALGQL